MLCAPIKHVAHLSKFCFLRKMFIAFIFPVYLEHEEEVS